MGIQLLDLEHRDNINPIALPTLQHKYLNALFKNKRSIEAVINYQLERYIGIQSKEENILPYVPSEEYNSPIEIQKEKNATRRDNIYP